MTTKSEVGSCYFAAFTYNAFHLKSNTTPAYLTMPCAPFLLHQHPGSGLGMLQFPISHFQNQRHLGKRERRMHAHGWHQSTPERFLGTRFRPNFRLPRILTNQIRILRARAELRGRADRRFLGVYKGSRVACLPFWLGLARVMLELESLHSNITLAGLNHSGKFAC